MYKSGALFFIILFFLSCDEERPNQVIPYAYVNQDINLNLIQYQDLKNIGGYVYINNSENAGYKGLIVYHEGGGVYRAFERACPYDPYSSCEATVVDDSGLFMVHTCCKSSFNFYGNPTGGPASVNMMQYLTYLDGIYLIIRNN